MKTKKTIGKSYANFYIKNTTISSLERLHIFKGIKKSFIIDEAVELLIKTKKEYQ